MRHVDAQAELSLHWCTGHFVGFVMLGSNLVNASATTKMNVKARYEKLHKQTVKVLGIKKSLVSGFLTDPSNLMGLQVFSASE